MAKAKDVKVMKVPTITIDGNTAQSNSLTPRDVPDTCACWNIEDQRRAMELMRQPGQVVAVDATAYAGLLAISLSLAYAGVPVMASITKGYEYENVILLV